MHDDNDVLKTSGEDSSLLTPETTHREGANARGASPPASRLDRRLQRISDYLDTALSSPMPEVALIGGINADLAAMQIRLSQSIEEILAECASARDYMDAVPEGVEMLLKVSRQIERGTRLAKDLSRSQVQREPTPRSNKSEPAS
jgi:hypothetical protein